MSGVRRLQIARNALADRWQRAARERGEPSPDQRDDGRDDLDAWYRRALAAGATSMEAPALQPYGERRAAVRDAFDNRWYLAAAVA
jgi:uncharacterized glyoxalase superfamily protein PhnB